MLSSFAQLRQQLHQSGPRSAVVAATQDEHTLQAVLAARRDGLIHPILVGPPDQLRPLLDRLGASVPEEDLVPAGTEAECAARAVALVRQGRGSLLIKGRLSTGALLGAVVDRAAKVSLFYDRTAGQKRGDLFADGGGFGDFEHDEDGVVVPRDKK